MTEEDKEDNAALVAALLFVARRDREKYDVVEALCQWMKDNILGWTTARRDSWLIRMAAAALESNENTSQVSVRAVMGILMAIDSGMAPKEAETKATRILITTVKQMGFMDEEETRAMVIQ